MSTDIANPGIPKAGGLNVHRRASTASSYTGSPKVKSYASNQYTDGTASLYMTPRCSFGDSTQNPPAAPASIRRQSREEQLAHQAKPATGASNYSDNQAIAKVADSKLKHPKFTSSSAVSLSTGRRGHRQPEDREIPDDPQVPLTSAAVPTPAKSASAALGTTLLRARTETPPRPLQTQAARQRRRDNLRDHFRKVRESLNCFRPKK